MINEIKIALLKQYDNEKIPSTNSVAYRLLLTLLTGDEYSNPALSKKIKGTANNAVTRLRGQFHWLVHYSDGKWWLDKRHLPVNGFICIRSNREASAEAFKLYAHSSAKQAKYGRIREPKAIRIAINADEKWHEVKAE